MPDENRAPRDHDAAWLLLPWLANGTLDATETAQVESHLATCEGCRRELTRCKDLAAALRSQPDDAPSPHPIQLSRLMARLETVTAEAASDEQPADRPAPVAPLAPLAPLSPITALAPAWLRATPRPVRWALAGQLAALLVLAVAVPLAPRLAGGAGRHPAASPARPALYHTLSAPGSTGSTGSTGATGADSATPRPQIRLVFSEQASEKQMRELLTKVRGRLVDGPSPLGTYTVEILAPRPGDSASDSLGTVLAYLATQRIVRFAEPVAGTSPRP